MNSNKRLLALAVSAALSAPITVYATNGMNLESYGPVAGGMGGASMAYDNGSAAVMNNPATIGLMDDGSRLDVAVGFLRPNVTTTMATPSGDVDMDSDATSFMMPALGWVKKSGQIAYGVSVFSQGGMGTEYAGMSSPGGMMSAGWMTSSAADFGMNPATSPSPCDVIGMFQGTNCAGADLSASGTDAAAGAVMNMDERSEVGVGRLLFPFTYAVNDQFNVGGSIDYVWAGMDLVMTMPGMMMADMMMNPNSSFGSITGGMPTAFGSMLASNGGSIYGLNYGRFDFTDGSDFKGEAKGTGFAGKIGITYKPMSNLTIGATYHSQTSLSDLEADGANVSMSVLMDVGGGTLMAVPMDMKGTVKVKDFEWPATMALGVAYQANDKLMIAADVKRINWSDVMSDFTMEFKADSITMGGNDVTSMFTGATDMTATMYQDWEDQTVVQLGVAYKVIDKTTVRVGYNQASNPIPDETMNYLFPAVTEKHYTFGAGYEISDASVVDFAYSYVPEVTAGGVNGFETSMSQSNFQLMYSQRF